MRRKRRHIPIIERLAAAYLMLMPQAMRDEMRARRAPAREVVRMFTDDHNVLHALGGADKAWNLTPRLRGPELKAKDSADTSIAAKVKRNDAAWGEFTRRMARKRPGKSARAKKKSKWPKRSMRWGTRPQSSGRAATTGRRAPPGIRSGRG